MLQVACGRAIVKGRTKMVMAAVVVTLEVLEARQLFAAGGGVMGAGFTGEYFANPNLSGAPAFTRKDVRVDFDWGTTIKPGGSNSPAMAALGTDNYSIRWTGTVVPTFSETYTFKVEADDGVRLMVRPVGSGTWKTLVNKWTSVGTWSAAYDMVAGESYEIKLEYREVTGSAKVKLKWSSASTKEETIDPLTESGINNPDFSAGYTDIMKGARNSWTGVNGGAAPSMDANGWPMGDAGYYFQESLKQGLLIDPLMLGKITFSFKGKATVKLHGNLDSSTLTYTYDAAKNVTTGSFMTRDAGWNASAITFVNSTRTGQAGGPGGITDLKLMRPVSPGASASYSASSAGIFTPQMIEAMSDYTVIRHQYVANQQKEWADRTTPGFFNQNRGTTTASRIGIGNASSNGASWEYKIMLSNESGRDLMISLPPLASDEYIRNLANLLKYGSDASGKPYTKQTANPAHPGLNPNLRVYFEIGNELWNWAGAFYTDFANVNALTAADADANNANFAAINYDNRSTAKDASGAYTSMGTWRYRKIIQRTFQISDMFRAVWGDGAMPGTSAEARVRPLYEWQYANINDTAGKALTWADNYYNNADGVAHVATPRPVNYYLWGGGGAAYYGATNGNGLTTLNPDYGMEAIQLPAGFNAAPSGTSYAFTGKSGIAVYVPENNLGIPAPFDGSQMGYITDQGSISFTVTIPENITSDVFAVSFKAYNRRKPGAASPDRQNLRVYLNGVTDITARTFSQKNGVTAPSSDQLTGWQARNVSWTKSYGYYTKVFQATPGQKVTITIKGMGDVNNAGATDQTAFLEDLRITSVDAIYAGGMPGGGEATGQPAGQKIRDTMNNEVSWAKAYGLEMLAYESGWSLGGDDGGSPLQLVAKYRDPRTIEVQGMFMDWFHQAGGAVNVFGTYQQWPSWSDFFAEQGYLDTSKYPIVEGVIDRSNKLPSAVTNGTKLANSGVTVLAAPQAKLTSRATTSKINAAGGWISYNIIVDKGGGYSIWVDASPGGTVRMVVDGKLVDTFASKDSLTRVPLDVDLEPGLHTIRVQSGGGVFDVSSVSVRAGSSNGVAPALAVYESQGLKSTSVELPAASVSGGVVVSSVTRGPGYKSGPWGNGLMVKPKDNVWPATLETAEASGKYFAFEMSPSPGGQMTLSGIKLRMYTQNGRTPDVIVQYSLDGIRYQSINATGVLGDMMVDLSGEGALQGVGVTVKFRVVMVGGGISPDETAGIGCLAGNDVIVYGFPGVVPVKPDAPVGKVIAGQQVQLSWGSMSDDVLNVRLERSAQPAFEGTSVVWMASESPYSIIDTTVIPGAAYHYRLVAMNRWGESIPSESTVVRISKKTVLLGAGVWSMIPVGDDRMVTRIDLDRDPDVESPWKLDELERPSITLA